MRILKLPCLAASLLLAIPLYAGQLSINGKVLSDTGVPLADAEISIGDLRAATDGAGLFSITPAPGELFTLKFSADGHYPMLHTFSELELAQFTGGDSATIPDVTLVERKQGRVLLAFGGDTMAGRRYSKPFAGEPALIRPGFEEEDTAALLRFMAPYLQLADYASVNLEIQVMESPPDTHAPKSVVFYTPPATLDAVAGAGVDHVTLGNNHIYDYLDEGLEMTLNALDASPLAWSGAGRTEEESLRAHRVQIGDHPYSYLGFLGWAGNFWPNQVAEAEEKGGAAYGSLDNVRVSVGRETAAGQLPVVHYHGSREYTDEPTLSTETRLKAAVDAGAVIAIGHHPHMVQGFEVYRDKLVAYSMGNFMFDQYMNPTQRSYMLYVWMDGDQFHRAEVMPMHIKGYVPMPATDSVREAVLRRAAVLSARRGTYLVPSGGHAVITSSGGQAATRMVSATNGDEGLSIWPVGPQWNVAIDSIELEDGQDKPVLLGMDMLPSGHFESFDSNGAPSRTWLQADGLQVVSDDTAPSGGKVMQVAIPAGQGKGTFGTRTFDLTFTPGTPTSLVFKAKASKPVTVTAYQQWRKRGQPRSEALRTAELRPIATRKLGAGDWQELRFDFDSERVSAYSYRVLVEFTPRDVEQDMTVHLDDVSLIEWLGPPLYEGKVPMHVETLQASHIGLISPSQ